MNAQPRPLDYPPPADAQPIQAPVEDPFGWTVTGMRSVAVSVGAFAGLTLTGWLYSGRAFITLNPALGVMRANTALSFVLGSLALFLLAPRDPHARALRYARAAAALVAIIGAGTLLGSVLTPENWFDHLLLWGASIPGASLPLRMGPNAAITLILTGTALLCLRRGPRAIGTAQTCAVGAMSIALLTILGHAYGIIEQRYWFTGAGMSPQTALSAVLIGLSVIASEPEHGLLGMLLRRGASGSTVRRLLPAVFLALVALGAIGVVVLRADRVDAETIIAWFALSSFLLIAGLVYWNATALAKVERLRAIAERERGEASARLAASEERFRLASRALRGWIYDFDLVTGRVERSAGLFQLLGVPRDEASDRNEWYLGRLHPEDAVASIERAHRAITGSEESLTQEYRVRTADGRYIWVWDHAVIVRDGQGRPLRMVGNVIDVTARHAAEAALRESEERFRNMADHSPGTVFLSDASGAFTFLSRAWFAITGQSPQSAQGHGWLAAVHPEEREVTRGILEAATARRIPCRFDLRLLERDGNVRWVYLAAAPRLDANGEFLGYVGSMVDITDRKQMEEELREADHRKDEFLAMLGHELRNPLAPIRSAAALMRHITVDDPKLAWAREVIERQVAHMTRLIDDLLDVARITRGSVQLRNQRVELARVVADAVELSRPLIEDRAHRFELAMPGERIWLDADAARLEQVFSNLLNNAAKYTEPGGRITFTVERQGPEVEIRVADTGVGIDRELLPRVFDLFTQDKRSIDRSQGGLGIGLTLVKALVELHGGTVSARSEGRGRGAEFVLRLPVAASGSGAAAEHGPPGRPRSAAPKRVLVVDDNADSADGIATLLAIEGHHVITAYDGPSALDKAHRLLPDVVLLDIGLPGMDGYEVARRMRASPDLRASRLVAVTGYGADADRQRSREAGFTEHLVKPVDVELLQRLISALEAA